MSLRTGSLPLLSLASVGALVAACSAPTGSLGETSEAISTPDPSLFALPPSDASARAAILAKYANVDPKDEVPRGLLEDALEYYDVNLAQIPNKGYLTIVDFSKYSGNYRFFLVDMNTGAVEKHKVAHGKNSDPNDTGYSTKFSNVDNSNESSLGYYLTSDVYDGTHPHSMHLNGLSPDGSPNHMANTNVLERSVVMHLATYVDDSSSDAQGRSNGCFALDPSIELSVVNRLTGGSILYADTKPLNPQIGRQKLPSP
jgi:hypothetical protein